MYISLFVLLTIAIKAYADTFTIKTGNIYSMGPLKAVLEFGAPFISLAVVGWSYLLALGRFSELRPNGT
ncbi:hypothetical protein CSC74_12975 [Pseudoxanthomonas yeongjuensis]|nr:hypothetical protein CSC74_12975 [Pseudoxanthomonas yeongjuensis]